MQAPADTPIEPPPDATDERATTREAPPSWPPPDRSRATWRRPSLPAAGWLAGAGATLLLVASVIVVASRWESIPAEARFAGLVAALIASYFVAEAGQRRFPTTSTALAALAATITAPVGVAAAATLGQPWPVCVSAGGLAALVCTEVQSRRWNVSALQAATVVAFGMAAVGASALTSVPAPLLGAVGAVAALVLGAARRGVALGAAVGLSPALVLLAEAGVGAGTLVRIGAVGEAIVWSAPLSCAIASIVVGVVAQRTQNLPLALSSIAVFASGAGAGLAAGDVGAVVWWSLPSVALLLLESVGTSNAPRPWRRLSVAAPYAALPILAAGLIAPVVLVEALAAASPPSPTWALPLSLAGIALAAATTGSIRRSGNGWLRATFLLGAAGAFAGAAAAAGAGLVVVALIVLVLWVAVSALTDWRTWELTTAVTAFWGLVALTADTAGSPWPHAALVAGFGVALVVAISFVERADAGVRLVVAALVTAGAMHAVVDTARPVEGSFTVVALIALGVALRPARALVPVSVAQAAVAVSFLDGDLGWWHVGLLTALAGAFAGAADRSPRSEWAHFSAGFLVGAGALALVVGGFDPVAITLLLGVAAVALTGLATLRTEYLPLDTAAIVAGGLTLLMSFAAEPVFVSLALALAGAQATVFGATARLRPVSIAGAAVFAAAVISMWWTTGTNALVIDAIAPYGATGTDIVMVVTGLALLGVGSLVRRSSGQSSWLAYGPGLGLLATWLLSRQLEPRADWATVAALTIGLVALGVGGLRRLAAPLVIGTVMIAGTLCISAGPRLAAAPTWAWIAVGGLALLALAAHVERHEHPLLPMGGSDSPSLLETFREEFE